MAASYDIALVADALRGAAAAADPGEIAHLAVTGKIEHHVRDRMAWWLTTHLDRQEVIVVREWHRVDLAVVSNSNPVGPLLLVEGKAHYHFDAFDARFDRYVEWVTRDLDRLASWPDATPAAVVLSTHIGSEVPVHLAGKVIKYGGAANRLLARFSGDPAAARKAMLEQIDGEYSAVGRTVGPITVADGVAWGLDIRIDGWIIDPNS